MGGAYLPLRTRKKVAAEARRYRTESMSGDIKIIFGKTKRLLSRGKQELAHDWKGK